MISEDKLYQLLDRLMIYLPEAKSIKLLIEKTKDKSEILIYIENLIRNSLKTIENNEIREKVKFGYEYVQKLKDIERNARSYEDDEMEELLSQI